MIWLYIALGIILLIILYLTASKIAFDRIFKIPKLKDEENIVLRKSKFCAIQMEFSANYCQNSIPFSLETKDKVVINGDIYIKDEKSDLFIIFVHGYHGHFKENSAIAEKLSEYLSFNSVFYSQRAHYYSKAKYTSMAYKESEDLYMIINYINEKYNFPRIVLFGDSMGGATVLNVNRFELSPNVKAIIEDSAYNSTYEEIKDCISEKERYLKIFLLGVRLYAKILFHTDIKNDGPCKYLKSRKIPLLLMHGKKDDFVLYKHHLLNLKDCNNGVPFEEVSFEEGEHVLLFYLDKEAYAKKVVSFIKQYVN